MLKGKKPKMNQETEKENLNRQQFRSSQWTSIDSLSWPFNAFCFCFKRSPSSRVLSDFYSIALI